MFDPQSNILVVDDAVSMRLTIINILKELGFSNFTEANNGKNAFALIEGGGKFDLILSDHNMPECTGLEFLKMVRALDAWKKTPFIMVTSETEKGMIVQAVQLGASNYVTKPVTKDALKAKLEATFARMKA
jgi:two-component system chemotaxis response regulator CheY